MPIIYSDEAKAARMEAVERLIQGGALEIGTSGMGTVLARVVIPPQSCSCDGDEITCNPQEGTFASADGKAAAARVMSAAGRPVITGLTVGQSKADVILDYVSLKNGQIVTIEGMSFRHA